jgi:hypothetical protein
MKRLILALLVMVAAATPSFAQVSTGNLIGTVSDPSGVVPGANITVKDNKTGKERTVVTSGEGSYSVSQLDPGNYTVTITAPGHKTYTATELKIDVGRDYALNPTLEVGDVNANVTVVAGADVVNSANGNLSDSVSPQQIQELPLDGRSPLSLIPLQAGTSKAAPNAVTYINGQRTSNTNLTRDGVNVNDNFIRANATDFSPERASSDDTGEFTITTQNAGADQGYGSAQIQLVTPRGQSIYHGALYEYNRNSHFAANSFNGNAAGLKRPYLNRNQFGGKVSGPIPFTAKKVFFFFDYERQFLRQSQTNTNIVLMPNARLGNFTYVDTNTPAVTHTVNLFSITPSNPATGAVGPTGINPIVQSRLIAPMPLPNGALGLNTGQFIINQGFNDDYKYYTGRIDYDLNQRNTINVVYTNKREDLQRPDVTADSFTAIPPVTQPGINKFLKLGWTSTWGTNFTNEASGGFSFPTAVFNRITDVPSFFLTSALTNLPETTFLNQGRSQHNYNMQDNATWTRGNHTFKFGALAQIFRVRPFNDAGINPSYALTTGQNTPQLAAANFPFPISPTSLATANSLYALLGGIIGTGTRTFNPTDPTQALSAQTLRQNYEFENYALYGNDQWRISPHLTLNFGLRYEINTGLKLQNLIALEPIIPNGADPVSAILDPNGGYQIIGGNAGTPGRFSKNDANNFAPVLSFAWSPEFKNKLLGDLFPGGGKTVIRGGFRISYLPDQFLTASRNANGGNAGLGSTAIQALQNGSSQLNLRVGDTLPLPVAPGAIALPRSYAFNNSATFSNFGTVFAVDPNLQTGRSQEYSIGIQRELGFQSALEVRYVGSYSNNLLRVLDYNQININAGGFLTDFLRAQANRNLTGNAFCTTAGCQTLTVFGTGANAPLRIGTAGGVTLATFNARLDAGTPADLALNLLNANLDFNAANTANPQFPLLANPNTGVADLLFNGARYNYNALQIEFRRRFSQGISFQANYTFSKDLTNAIGTSQALTDTALDNNRFELEYMRADFDQPHIFNFNGIYELPFGKGKHWLNDSNVMDKIFGGFQASTIIRYGTGRPITIVDPRGTFNRAARAARQTANSSLTKDQIKNLFGRFEKDGVLYYINPAVLSISQSKDPATGVVTTTSRATNGPGQTPFAGQVFFNVPAGQVGNLERSIVNGPKQFTMDVSFVKKVAINERMRLEFRGEAFNVLNHNNYLLPLTIDINSGTFGQLTPGLSEQSSGFDSPRRLQFAIRFEF